MNAGSELVQEGSVPVHEMHRVRILELTELGLRDQVSLHHCRSSC